MVSSETLTQRVLSAKVKLPAGYAFTGAAREKRRKITLFELWKAFMNEIRKMDTERGKLMVDIRQEKVSVIYLKNGNNNNKETALKRNVTELLILSRHNSDVAAVIPRKLSHFNLYQTEKFLLKFLERSNGKITFIGPVHYLKTILLNKKIAELMARKSYLLTATNSKEIDFPTSVDYFGVKMVETPADLESVKQTMIELGYRIFVIE
jgi:hypothetical protein